VTTEGEQAPSTHGFGPDTGQVDLKGGRIGNTRDRPGSAWENGYCESSNGRMRDELLKGEIFYSLRET